MPFTLSHPLAVVPFRRWCPLRLNFAALVIGSMSPDFGYFVNEFDMAGFAHSILGLFAVCLPTGLLVLGIFYLLRRPLCFILPQPHRAALMPLAIATPPLSVRGLLIATLSVVLGAWTHLFWDSFTHSYGWPVEQLKLIHAYVIRVGNTIIPTAGVLQNISSLVGSVGLMLLYFLWLRRQPRAIPSAPGALSDRWRDIALAVMVITTLSAAIAATLWKLSTLDDGATFDKFVYWAVIYSISIFFPLLAVYSVAIYTACQQRD